ncbi:hypothetical protein FACS1894166_09310 [Bacilli bacterium]|nr:hypothetical protein FACS1894166_09310 [Bacilli bacterium]
MKTKIKAGLAALGLCVSALPIALTITSCGRDYLDIIDGVQCNFEDHVVSHYIVLSKDNSDKKNYDVYSAVIDDADMSATGMGLIFSVVMTTLLDVDPTTVSAHFSLDITSKDNVIPEVNFPIQPLSLDLEDSPPTYTNNTLVVNNKYSNYMAICLGYSELYQLHTPRAEVQTLDL